MKYTASQLIKRIWPFRRAAVIFTDCVYRPENGELVIHIEARNAARSLFATNVIRLKYMTIRPQVITEAEAADIFCAFTLPHLAAQNIAAEVHGPLTQMQFDFWKEYCAKLLIGTSLRPDFRRQPCGYQETPSSDMPTTASRIALLFGGGVESLTALSEFLPSKPLLLSLVGPLWMNNDHAASELKFDLENRLLAEFDLEIARVWHNLKEVVVTPDEYMNKYITGGLMYYLFTPVIREKNCGVVYHSMEREYLIVNEQYDRSIHPLFSHHVARSTLAPLRTMMTEYTKIELLDRLYGNNPKLCAYLYSCLNNTQLRWCGKCCKCRRLSAFCEEVGINKSLIGMQEGIPYEPETGTLTKLFWQNLDAYKARRSSSIATSSHIVGEDRQ